VNTSSNWSTRINIRLKKLSDHRYLCRRYIPSFKGNPLAHYFLGPKGIEIVSKAFGKESSHIERERERLSEQKDFFLNHFLFINEFRLALVLAIKDHPQMTLERWLKEKECCIHFFLRRAPKHPSVHLMQGRISFTLPSLAFTSSIFETTFS
jgi:hypothetical protein